MTSNPKPLNSTLQRGARSGFTLVEVLIALGVLGVMSGGCFVGFNSINAYACSSRLYSEAQTAAQNQIDLILSREPFDVMVAPKKIPLELMTAAELAALNPPLATSPPSSSNIYYPYYKDTTTGLLAKQAFIYTDPTKIDTTTGLPSVVVTGTLTTEITDLGVTPPPAPDNDSMTLEGVTTNLNSRRATVKVTYYYRKPPKSDGTPDPYTVAMDTIRTADR